MYLTEEDKERIKDENDRTIETMKKGNMPDNESECFRGLECRGVTTRSNQMRAMREIVTSLIISEQEEGDELCPDWIENVLWNITADSVAQACEVAYWDAQSVLKDMAVSFTRHSFPSYRE